MRDFPRFSIGGSLLLGAYLYISKIAFDWSIYGDSLYRTGAGGFTNSSSVTLNGVVMATSLLNAISHSAVVLGALHDTYVLSILVGVGFDVLTQSLRLIWWLQLTLIAFRQHETMGESLTLWNFLREYAPTFIFLMVLMEMYVYHMITHVGALRISRHSYKRVMGLLQSSLNNLRGIPGDKYEDHIFAYTDLGGHLAPLLLSINLLNRQGEMKSGFWILLYLVLASVVILSRIPFNQCTNNVPILKCTMGKIDCRCLACAARLKETGNCSSFTFSMRDGVCHLWLYSFEELAMKLEKTGEFLKCKQ